LIHSYVYTLEIYQELFLACDHFVPSPVLDIIWPLSFHILSCQYSRTIFNVNRHYSFMHPWLWIFNIKHSKRDISNPKKSLKQCFIQIQKHIKKAPRACINLSFNFKRLYDFIEIYMSAFFICFWIFWKDYMILDLYIDDLCDINL